MLRNYRLGASGFFVLIHAGALSVFFFPFSRHLLFWMLATYFVRTFGITAGYHRYFSHRSYKLNRFWQFLMAFLAQTSAQKGVLWWAAQHRQHHRYSDRDGDVHSPVRRGFWWAHVGWVLSNDHDGYDPRQIADFARYPELRWLDRHHWVPTVLLAAALLLVGGPAVFAWGYLLSTVVLYHFTFSINSLAHMFGSRRFETLDDSRNNWALALITLGEGWHNNHHFSMSSCRQGDRWWELDITYLVLRFASLLGIARDLRPFRKDPQRVREAA